MRTPKSEHLSVDLIKAHMDMCRHEIIEHGKRITRVEEKLHEVADLLYELLERDEE